MAVIFWHSSVFSAFLGVGMILKLGGGGLSHGEHVLPTVVTLHRLIDTSKICTQIIINPQNKDSCYTMMLQSHLAEF